MPANRSFGQSSNYWQPIWRFTTLFNRSTMLDDWPAFRLDSLHLCCFHLLYISSTSFLSLHLLDKDLPSSLLPSQRKRGNVSGNLTFFGLPFSNKKPPKHWLMTVKNFIFVDSKCWESFEDRKFGPLAVQNYLSSTSLETMENLPWSRCLQLTYMLGLGILSKFSVSYDFGFPRS